MAKMRSVLAASLLAAPLLMLAGAADAAPRRAAPVDPEAAATAKLNDMSFTKASDGQNWGAVPPPAPMSAAKPTRAKKKAM